MAKTIRGPSMADIRGHGGILHVWIVPPELFLQACMMRCLRVREHPTWQLALPTLLVHGNLPYLLQRAEHEKQARDRVLLFNRKSL